MLANNVDPDQMPHDVASDHGIHCFGFPNKNDETKIFNREAQ